MKGERWQTAWQVFESACSLPPEQRRAYVESTADPEIAADVFAMLDNQDAASTTNPGTEFQHEDPPVEWPQLGQTIAQYAIRSPLGRGGMGEVYLAEDLELHRRVALKFVASGRLSTEAELNRLLREARIASALNHPNIVTVYEVVRAGDAVAIVMEMVEGQSLRTRCGSPQPTEQVQAWGQQAAAALAAAHAQAIAHRDIKPENLILRSDGQLKVLDFGLAREEIAGRQTSTMAVAAGTLRYLSPEQAGGGRATRASDIFSLGIVLYELAAGIHPFEAPSPLAVAYAIATRPATPPSKIHRTIPRALDDLVLSMLQKDPEKRPDAAEVERRLAEAISAPSTEWTRLPGRRTWPIYLAVTTAIALAVVSWWRLSVRPAATPAETPLLHHTPLTESAGNQSRPAFSPDGSEVAYLTNGGREGPERRVWIRTGDGASIPLTQGKGDEFDLAWSPEGRQIALLRNTGAGTQVVVAPRAGGEERVVTTVSAEATVARRRLAWPEAGWLLVSDRAGPSNEAAALFRIGVSGGDRIALTSPAPGASDVAPTVSPDGTRLVFLRGRGGVAREIYGMELGGAAGARPRLLWSSAVPIESIAWLPDGGHLLFSAGAVIPNQLWRIAFAGGSAEPVDFRLKDAARDLAVDPHGSRLALMRPLTVSNVWNVSPGPPPRWTQLTFTPREEIDVARSPDGTSMVYSSKKTGDLELWTASLDGSHPRQITFQGLSELPSWSPDGTQFVYQIRQHRDLAFDGHASVWLIGAHGGQPRRLRDEAPDSFFPSWSRDGKWVYFCSTRGGSRQIWRSRLTGGGEPELITPNGGWDGFESPDGQSFYFAKGNTGMWRMHLGETREESIPELADVLHYRVWDLAQTGIYMADVRALQLFFFSFETRQSRPLVALPHLEDANHRTLSAAPDGSSFLLARYGADRTEIVMVKLPN